MNILKKMALLTLMVPAITIAGDACIAPPSGECTPGGGSGNSTWVGVWFDLEAFQRRYVYANTSRQCNDLLIQATAGNPNALVGTCGRA